MTTQPPNLVLLYDGLCGFCNGAVRFILKHDQDGTMRFAPLQGVFAHDVLARHASLRDVDSLILVKRDPRTSTEQIAARSEAVLQIAEYLGGGWRVTRALRILPSGLRDWAYDRLARARYKLYGRHDACPAPSPDSKARFLA